jgi:hypothetical protein
MWTSVSPCPQADVNDWQINDNIAVEGATMSVSGLVNTDNGGFEFEA